MNQNISEWKCFIELFQAVEDLGPCMEAFDNSDLKGNSSDRIIHTPSSSPRPQNAHDPLKPLVGGRRLELWTSCLKGWGPGCDGTKREYSPLIFEEATSYRIVYNGPSL